MSDQWRTKVRRDAAATILAQYPDGAQVVVVQRDVRRDADAKATRFNVRMTVLASVEGADDTVISDTRLVSDAITGAARLDVAEYANASVFLACAKELRLLFFPRTETA